MDFEDMMNELMGGNDLDKALDEAIPPMIKIFSATYDEMIFNGFDEKQSFEFAKELTLKFLNN